MPLVLIVSPGHPLPEPIRATLAALSQPYVIECWARGRWCCPICASSINLIGTGEGKQAKCWTCGTPFWCRLNDAGDLVSSTDNPVDRK